MVSGNIIIYKGLGDHLKKMLQKYKVLLPQLYKNIFLLL